MGGLKWVARRFDDWLSPTDPAKFEGLLAGHYRQGGFVVDEYGTGDTGRRLDGGVDLRLCSSVARRGTPLIVVNGRRVHGFNASRLDSVLDDQRPKGERPC